jgi:pimeloyl-ACP methyl ester carboxylesterase
MKPLFLLTLVFIFTHQAQAQSFFHLYGNPASSIEQVREGHSNFVRLANNNILFARFTPPSDPKKPTIVLMNGLPDDLNNWGRLDYSLAEKGYGVLVFDFKGQGFTLAYNAPNLGDLSWQSQVEDIKHLLNFFRLRKVIVSGLSYGGGMALAFGAIYPERVHKVVAFAPFIEPIEATESSIKKGVQFFEKFLPNSDKDRLFQDLFRLMVYTTYPMAEPSILLHPLKPEAITRMALGIRELDMKTLIHRLPERSLNLIGGTHDEHVTLDVIERLWDKAPLKVRQSYTTIESSHRITNINPDFATLLFDAINENKIYNPYDRLHTQNKRALDFKTIQRPGSLRLPLCRDIFL